MPYATASRLLPLELVAAVMVSVTPSVGIASAPPWELIAYISVIIGTYPPPIPIAAHNVGEMPSSVIVAFLWLLCRINIYQICSACRLSSLPPTPAEFCALSCGMQRIRGGILNNQISHICRSVFVVAHDGVASTSPICSVCFVALYHAGNVVCVALDTVQGFRHPPVSVWL